MLGRGVLLRHPNEIVSTRARRRRSGHSYEDVGRRSTKTVATPVI